MLHVGPFYSRYCHSGENMKNAPSFAVAVLLIAGCATQAPTVWYKDGATEEQFRRDQMSCRQYGMQSAQANGLAGNIFVEIWISDEATKCLKNLGYQQDYAKRSMQYSAQDSNYHPAPNMSCASDSDCENGQSCRSRKGGGTECRR